MDYFDCRILKTLHESMNITKASHSLFISQPALTKRLKQLENEFDIQIINRHSKGISFTRKGEYLVSVADHMLTDYELTKNTLRCLEGDNVSGTLKIGGIYLLNERILPDLIANFSASNPDVTFNILSQPNVIIFNKLSNNEIHLAFLRENFSSGFERILIEEDGMFIISKNEISLEELPQLPRIDPVRNNKLNAELDKWWAGNYDVPPKIFATVSNSNIGIELVSKGLGYSIVPNTILAGREDEFFKIRLIDDAGRPYTRKTWMYYKKDMLRFGQVAAFVEFMRKNVNIEKK